MAPIGNIVFSRIRLRWLLWGFWFASAASLLYVQAAGVIGLYRNGGRAAHPEIPGANPEAVLAVIAVCSAEASPDDILGVAFSGGDAVQLFIAYRLAYDLYPRTVVSQNYPGDDVQRAIDLVNSYTKPTLWLVFSKSGFTPPPGARIIDRLDSLLYRIPGPGEL